MHYGLCIAEEARRKKGLEHSRARRARIVKKMRLKKLSRLMRGPHRPPGDGRASDLDCAADKHRRAQTIRSAVL
jgi:hypothetical protein